MQWIVSILTLATSLLVTIPASAQPNPRDRDSDILVRVNGQVAVAAGDSNSIVAVINDTATIDGIVRQVLIVINGTAVIRGTIREKLVVINGDAILQDGAQVKDVHLYGSTITRSPGATITGQVEQESTTFINRGTSWLFWISITIAALILGLIAMAFMGRQLVEATELFVSNLWPVVLTGLIVWIGLPLIAVFAFFTVIGIPLGISIFIGLMPILWFLGYVVASLIIGGIVLHRRWRLELNPSGRMFSEAAMGILLLQILSLIPGIGGLIVIVASWLGSGALVLRSWRRWRGRESGISTEPEAPPLPISPTLG
jgi:hypothetical protein